jgi:hypothetical protein
MDEFSQQEQIFMLGAFAMAVRSGGFSGKCHGVLSEGTVQGTISHVVQTFRAKEDRTQQKMGILSLASFYQDYSKSLKTTISNKSNKRPFRSPARQISKTSGHRDGYSIGTT